MRLQSSRAYGVRTLAFNLRQEKKNENVHLFQEVARVPQRIWSPHERYTGACVSVCVDQNMRARLPSAFIQHVDRPATKDPQTSSCEPDLQL